ncbi:MAG: glycosyltransferase family 2 protein [Bdellovibrionota bacterium]
MPISAVIICKNEEANIERCLKSLTWVDEVVVYDSGSTDNTINIAQKMGAKVHQGLWLGFGATKHEATNRASHDWILSIDADEEVPDQLRREIQQKLSTLDADYIYKIPRLSYYLQSWIKYGGWYPDFQIRLFNRKTHQWNKAEIHEQVEPLRGDTEHIAQLEHHLHHYVFKNIEHQVQTNNRYSTLQAQTMFASGTSFSYFHLFTKPYVKFVECYILKLGFLDGWAGYVIARNAAYSALLKWLKLRELYAQKK